MIWVPVKSTWLGRSSDFLFGAFHLDLTKECSRALSIDFLPFTLSHTLDLMDLMALRAHRIKIAWLSSLSLALLAFVAVSCIAMLQPAAAAAAAAAGIAKPLQKTYFIHESCYDKDPRFDQVLLEIQTNARRATSRTFLSELGTDEDWARILRVIFNAGSQDRSHRYTTSPTYMSVWQDDESSFYATELIISREIILAFPCIIMYLH